MKRDKKKKKKGRKASNSLIIKILTYPAQAILEMGRHTLVLRRRKIPSASIRQWYACPKLQRQVDIQVEEDAPTTMTQPLLFHMFLVCGTDSPGYHN